MSRIRIVKGSITKTSGGDTTMECLNGKFISSSRLTNEWTSETEIIEKEYVSDSGGLDEVINAYWTDLNNKKINSAFFGDEVRYHVETKNVPNNTPLLIQLLEQNTTSDQKLLKTKQSVIINNDKGYVGYLLDYDWVKYLFDTGEGDELELICQIFGWGRNTKMSAELKVSIGEIPQLILVNGYWNRLGELLNFSPGSGGKEYWNVFLGGLNTFISNAETYYGIKVKNNLPFYFDGSSFAGFTSGGKQRKQEGYDKAEKLFSKLKNKSNKQPLCLVGHSEGCAYACGVAEYLKSIGYTIKENLLLHCDEADEFEVSNQIPTYQLNAMYFTKDSSVLKKIANYAKFWYHSQQIRKVGDYYAVVDWVVGDYKLKGVKKYGVIIANLVKYPNISWSNIHTYLVDNNVFDWIDDLKQVVTSNVMVGYNGKVHTGKDQTIPNNKTNFYRIDNDYIITNYPP